ncbi:MAG: helix-turn-helix transcriptional regulator [Thermoplasmataceae archaeon]
MTFSPQYSNFQDWISNFKGSESYRNRIIRLHSKYPQASLSQLRGHPKAKERIVSAIKPEPVYKRSWSAITKRELNHREKSLDVLSKVRKGQSLTKASTELHTSPEAVIKNTGAFKKVKGKWIAKSQDRISRIMSIYENGKQEWVEIKDSRIASKIGKYNSAVNEFLRTGNTKVLKQFRKPFKDFNGKKHYFETNPDKLNEIAEQQEEPEFYEIYKIA